MVGSPFSRGEVRPVSRICLCDARRVAHDHSNRVACWAPHNSGGHISHEMCSSTFGAGKPHTPFGRRTVASTRATECATSDPTGAGASINSEPHSEEGWVFTEIGVYSVVGAMEDKLIAHKHYIEKHSQDLPEIRNWKWGQLETQS